MKFCCGLILSILLLIGNNASAQVAEPCDERDTYYAELWNIYNSHTRISYIAYPWMRENGVSGFPLLFEANISPYFTFYKGNVRSRKQWRSFQVYFNPELTLRMYSQDPIGVRTNSLPVRPLNFHPRLSFVKFLHGKDADKTSSDELKNYSFLEATVAHYSNGQENPHYWQDSVNVLGDSIPNFVGGNFSTNYWRLAYTYGWFDKLRNVYSISPYIQNDGGAGDLFSYDDAQLRSYGKWRAGATFQFMSNKVRLGKKSTKVGFKYQDGAATKKKKDMDYNVTFQARYSPEVIFDDVSLYPSTRKNRWSHRATFIFHPLNWRHAGIFLEFYTGRDFYNIRYYDRITQFKIGITASPDFYIPRNP